MDETKPLTIVIFGATGDLTARKLIPALLHSYCKNRLSQEFYVVGYARRPWSDDDFREHLRDGLDEFASDTFTAEEWQAFARHLRYVQGDLQTEADFEKLRDYLPELEGGPANRLYYLAIAPRYFVPVIENLGAADMVDEVEGWRRVVVEKPFGHDLESAQELNKAVHAVFLEHQIYRIDHYLGKETAQNILYFRFANTIFEPVWTRNYVENVQIAVMESVDVGHRAGYYDQAGVVRDMFQNHLLQLLSLVAMESPASFDAEAVRNEKVKLLSSIRPVVLSDTVRGQYRGYRETEGVAPGSQTPTFAVLKLFIDNWRWKGVPFYLCSGKAAMAKYTQINIEFQKPPHLMFEHMVEDFTPNILSFCIQPDEGIHLTLQAKVPDAREMRSVDMEFHYRDSFGDNSLPDAYERLLLDVIRGDASLYTRSDGIEAAWRLVDAVIQGWERDPDAPPLATYEPGTWGADEGKALLARDGHVWREGCHDYVV